MIDDNGPEQYIYTFDEPEDDFSEWQYYELSPPPPTTCGCCQCEGYCTGSGNCEECMFPDE